MTDQELLTRYYNGMTARGLSPNTVRRRKLTLDRYAAAQAELATADGNDVEAWLASLNVKPSSRALYLGDIRCFYRWAIKHDYLTTDPTVKVDAPRRPKYIPRPIPTDQLLDAIDAAPARIRTMLTLAAYAGLRCAEIANLRCEDIDHESGNVRVTHGKGDKPRIVALHPAVALLVEPGSRGPVVGWRGEHIGADAVSNALAAYLREGAGLDATGHQARHWYGTELYAATQDLAAVQEAMGHADPSTTMGYVALNPEVARRGVAALPYRP